MKRKKPTSITFASAIFVPSTLSAASVVFTETFDGVTIVASSSASQTLTDPTIASDAVYTGNNGFAVTPSPTPGDGAGTIGLTNIGNARGITFFVNLAGFTAGAYEIDYGLSQFAQTTDRPDAALFASLSLITGLDAMNGVSFDLHVGGGGLQPDTNAGGLAPAGGSTATVTSLSNDILFTGTGTTTGSFNLINDGDANSLLAVTLIRDPGSTATGTTTSSFTVDTVTIEAVPEPSSALLVGLSFLGLIARRRR